MALYSILILSACTFFLVQASSTNPKFVSARVRSEKGQSEIFAKDFRGRAVKAVVLEKANESPVSAITLVTDGQKVLVKSEFDQNGLLIDCDLIDNRADIDRFSMHVEESIRTAAARNHGHHRHVPVDNLGDDHQDMFDVESRVKACQQLISNRYTSEIKSLDDQEVVEEHGKRAKRSYLIWPGTNWCGKGSKAEFAGNFGTNKEADQCCQKHDQCPYVIAGFTTRYNLFNYRIHTLSHCDCDIPFMSCLKEANTTTSNMLGKVYFNVVNTECFDLSLQKSCAKRNWWGGCEKYTTKWTANIKTLGNFPVVE